MNKGMNILWKESYCTGVERIDFQHKSLFSKAQKLLDAIRQNAGQAAYREIFTYIKCYAVFHFRDEEKFQRSVGYKDYESHKKSHSNFTRVVEDFEARLEQSNYGLETVQELAGALTAWLVYHVTHADQKIVEPLQLPERSLSIIQVFSSSVGETLQSVAGLSPEQVREYDAAVENITGEVQVDVELTGELNGVLNCVYSKELAFNCFHRMLGRKPAEIDLLVGSCLAEITNISAGSAATALSKRGIAFDIRPPTICQDKNLHTPFDGVILDTAIGKLKVCAALDQY